MKFVALDFETTGLDPERHGPLTLGMYSGEFELFTRMFSPVYEIDEQALMVNKISPLEFTKYEMTMWVDLDFAAMLRTCGVTYGDLCPVGFNVAQFDMQFMKKWMPNTYRYFGHRSFELNTAIMQRAGVGWRDYKEAAINDALSDLEMDKEDLHDAFNDAMVAWRIFTILVPDWEEMQDEL